MAVLNSYLEKVNVSIFDFLPEYLGNGPNQFLFNFTDGHQWDCRLKSRIFTMNPTCSFFPSPQVGLWRVRS